MNNVLTLVDYGSSPAYWHEFVRYVKANSDPIEWENGEGLDCYSYRRITETLQNDWKCEVDFTKGASIIFPSEGHFNLFQLKYASQF